MIKHQLKFNNEDKPLLNWFAIIKQIKHEFSISDLTKYVFTITIQKLRQGKTYSQLKYFNAVTVNNWVKGLKNAEGYVPIGEAGKDYAKFHIKTLPGIMFVKKEKNQYTGKEHYVLRSCKDASKEEMSQMIEIGNAVCEEYFGIECESVEQYKKRNGYK